MNRSTRIVKKLLALFLVVLMSIESFGAIVSDNDGSAFITKAEFDSKVNEFNTEINRYETSIDAKLQGAISSYLSGVRIQVKPAVFYERICGAIGTAAPFFFSAGLPAGSSSLQPQLTISKGKNYSLYYSRTPKESFAHLRFVPAEGRGGDTFFYVYLWGDTRCTPVSSWSGYDGLGLSFYALFTSSSWNHTKSSNQQIKQIGYQSDSFIDIAIPTWEGSTIEYNIAKSSVDSIGYSVPTTSTVWETIDAGSTKSIVAPVSDEVGSSTTSRYHIFFKTSTMRNPVADVVGDGVRYLMSLTGKYNRGIQFTANAVEYARLDEWGTTWGSAPAGSGLNFNYLIAPSILSRSGSGTQWEYDLLPNGNKTLKKYYTTYYPSNMFNLNYKTYKNYSSVTTYAANCFKDDNACTYSPSQTATWGRTVYGTNHTAYGTQNKVGYLEQILSLTKSTTDNNDYRIAQWGNGTNSNIYACYVDPPVVKSSTNLASSYTNLAASSFTAEGFSHTTTAVTNNVYQMNVTPTAYKLNTFENSYYTGIAGESVKLGYGIPIMMTNADDSARYTITIPVKQTVAPAGTTAASGNVTARLSLNHFVDGAFATAADKVWEGTITCNSSGVGSVTFTVDGIPRGKQLWLNLFGTTNSRKVELTGFNVNMS